MQATAAALLPYLMEAMGQGGSSSEEDLGDENLAMACEIDSDFDSKNWWGSLCENQVKATSGRIQNWVALRSTSVCVRPLAST